MIFSLVGSQGLARYRDLLDFPARFLAGLCGFDARADFRAGFLAAAFAVFAVGLKLLREHSSTLLLVLSIWWLRSSFLASSSPSA